MDGCNASNSRDAGQVDKDKKRQLYNTIVKLQNKENKISLYIRPDEGVSTSINVTVTSDSVPKVAKVQSSLSSSSLHFSNLFIILSDLCF